ncbi:PQQ-dependent sugar dehydrogenase [Ramlibacter sp. G-1-2-2]|uniref:PQQ-dependent sugar dehydrogenase n=1 Tax=Ramlibacter agri TaxID=2728837 RepID=A0A848HBC7_9BURK|nr:PQQ-dependent sugar dehydrogenase [Ramlibacter agri]NML48075.1 PQQ-dependent sugar dehydrogenase [Ramlibacter agri]
MSQHPICRRIATHCVALIVAAFLANPSIAQVPRPETLASGLEHPWAVVFLPQGRFLVTERAGRMRIIEADGKVGAPIAGVPDVVARGQGGLLDVALDSGFARNRTLYFCYSEAGQGGSGTALASAQLAEDGRRLEDVKVILRQRPKESGNLQYGCRIAEAPDGHLFLALGERFYPKEKAQTLDNTLGKVVRIAKDGSVPKDNPFASRAGALAETWTYGHRNPQGLAFGPDGALWEIEHGPQGGDEINILQAGRNYGWPVITYGENYGGGKIGEGITHKEGMEQPLHYWVPSIAPSGMAFLTSDRYGPEWKGNLFVGSLKFQFLDRIELAGGKVVREQKLLQGIGRLRDVRQGPDGLLYVLTDEDNGKLVRLTP